MRNIFRISGILLILSYFSLSCHTSEKTAVSCPEFSINKNRVTAYPKRIKNGSFSSHLRVNTRKKPIRLSGKKPEKEFVVFKNSHTQDGLVVPGIESVFDSNTIECLKRLIASTDNAISPLVRNSTTTQLMKEIDVNIQSNNLFITYSSGCDTIVLKSGSILLVKVKETGQYEIKYKECNNYNGPVFSISKSDVSEIKYINGTHEIITSTNPYDFVLNNTTINDNNTTIRKARFRIPGFVFSLAGLFVLGGFLVFGLPGSIFTGLALGLMVIVRRSINRIRIKRNPDKFKEKRSEIASLLIDIVVVVGVVLGLIYLLFFLMFILGSLSS